MGRQQMQPPMTCCHHWTTCVQQQHQQQHHQQQQQQQQQSLEAGGTRGMAHRLQPRRQQQRQRHLRLAWAVLAAACGRCHVTCHPHAWPGLPRNRQQQQQHTA
jgi:hypothetical protein